MQKVFDLTNQDGKDFLTRWNITSGEIWQDQNKSNFFYLLTPNYVYYLPFKNSGCKAGCFGDNQYFTRQLKNIIKTDTV